MLSKSDIEWIKGIREDVRSNRVTDIKIEGDDFKGKDPITGEPINKPFILTVKAVVTEISVRTAVDRYQNNGIEIRTGDIVIDISLEDLPVGFSGESIRRAIKTDPSGDIKYKILSSDRLGLGEENRLELLGRRIT